MSTADRLVTRDIWVRHTEPNGKQFVREHRVWDGDKFIASQQKAAMNLNADQKNSLLRKAKIEQITEEQYRKEKSK